MKGRHALRVAGTSAHRVDGAEKVTGKALYTGDITLPGMGFAKILRSPVAHARIAKIDARKAESMPGVLAVLTRDDLKALNYQYGAIYKDQSIVAVDKVRFAASESASTSFPLCPKRSGARFDKKKPFNAFKLLETFQRLSLI